MKLAQSFEAIDKNEHFIKSFDCGKPEMNNFLYRFALKHAKLGLSRTLVLPVEEPNEVKKKIAAYYTLAATTVTKLEIPTRHSLPLYPLPVALLARLAVDMNFRSVGLGEKSLVYALCHTTRLCDEGLPVFGVILDVLDDDALKFYQRFNFFHRFTDDPMRLFAPMNVLRKI